MLEGKRVAVAGRFKDKTVGMVKLALERAGAIVLSRVGPTTELFVAGAGHTAQHARAAELGIPTVDDRALTALLDEARADPGAGARGERAVEAALATVAACEPWDDSAAFASKRARVAAWNKHQQAHKKAARAIEALAAEGHYPALADMLEHPSLPLRSVAAMALLGISVSAGERPRWAPAPPALRERVAALLSGPPSVTDHTAAQAWFSLDADAAVDRLAREIAPAKLSDPLADRRMADIVRATPPDLEGAPARRWFEHLAAALEWAAYGLNDATIRLLRRADRRTLVHALARPLSSATFDRILANLRDVPDAHLPGWYREASRAPGVEPARAERLARLAGPPEFESTPAPLTMLGEASWDGGPMLLAAEDVVGAWGGSSPPDGGRIVETDHRWDDPSAPATDYDLACEVYLHAALRPVGSGVGLVIPLSWAAIATTAVHAGFFVIVRGEDELCARYAMSGPSAGWTDLGTLEVGPSGGLVVFSAAWPGRDWREAGGARGAVRPGRYRLEELMFNDERGELQFVRATRVSAADS